MHNEKVSLYLTSFLWVLFFLPHSSDAMMQYALSCPGREKLIIMHTDYNISTLKWGGHFFVAPRPEIARAKSGERRIYRFLNHDTLIVERTNGLYYFIYNDTEIVKCIKTQDVAILRAPLKHSN